MSQPQMFGRYLLLDKVAAGGMAEVWRAKVSGESGFQKLFAVKKILAHVAEDEDFITMFTDEAKITSQLMHSNIGQVYEFNKIGDVFYIAMEYISGKDLKSLWTYCRQRRTVMPIELSAFIIAKMADGLDYAHQKRDSQGNPAGIVHRDVSPQNALISWEGDVKVIDFGIAKATEKSGKTRPGTLKGKFAYMAPEQIRGLPLDGRADLFALGVCLYEMCTGERGFTADSEFSLLEMVRNVEIRPPSLLNAQLPAEMERIIYKALSKDRDQRYNSCADLSEDLQRFLLMRGKPPQPRDLAAWMRENFTVDFDKERGRLESYKELNAADYAPAPAPKPLDISIEEDDGDGAFASAEPEPPPRTPTNPGIRPATAVGIRPAATVGARGGNTGIVTVGNENTNGRTPTIGHAMAPPGEATGYFPPPAPPARNPAKIAAIAGGGTLAALALVVGLYAALRPSCKVTVEVKGPAKATVKLDERAPVTSTLAVFDDVKPGAHTLVVEEPGYVAFRQPIVVPADAESFPVTASLKRVASRLVVTSDPSGGTITLDGKTLEVRTPSILEVEGDSIHEVRVKADGYKEGLKSDLRVGGGSEVEVKLKLLPEKVRIRVLSVPEGASVSIGGQNLGVTPVTIERLPDDPYPQVEIAKSGCATVKTTVPFDREKADDRYELTLKCK